MNPFDLIVVQPIFNVLILIYSVIPGADFGIALIILTIIIRFLMWPLVKKQLHQTKAMRKLQPELKKLRKAAGTNKQLAGMQMMELYKKHGINPFRSIGILLIQLPIFIALYRVIQIFTMHRDRVGDFTYGFLENIPIIQNLITDPGSFNENLLGFINLTEHAVSSNGINAILILLALTAAITQYIVSKQTMPQQDSDKRLRDLLAEAGEGKQPDQSEMNAIVMRKMMKFLPVMMFMIMINLPAALALYYAVSNIVAAVQQSFILRKDEEEIEVITAETKKQTTTGVKKTTTKKSSTKKTPKPTRAKLSSDTTVTRITAKDTRPRKKKS